MCNCSDWDMILKDYIHRLISPDKRDTFESTTMLSSKIIDIANINKSSTVIDMGAGWGDLTLEIARLACKVIAIEPSGKNIKMAKQRAIENKICNIEFVKGRFEEPNCCVKADIAISSLVFHQVPFKKRESAIASIASLLKDGGTFVLCDTLMLFDPFSEPKKFNQVYRYILPRTLPKNIYEKQVKPYLENDKEHIYTWDDMKKYTPKNNWFYTQNELKDIFDTAGLKIIDKEILTPFFGIVKAKLWS